MTTQTQTTVVTTTANVLRANETLNIVLDFNLSDVTYVTPIEPIKLLSILSNKAILQQGKPIRVSGTATPGTVALVKIVLNSNQAIQFQNYSIVDDAGNYIVELPALSASFDSYTLTVSDTITEIRATDILIGEVWIAGGQSNMGLKVKEMEDGALTMSQANNNKIRIFYQYEGDNNANYPFTPNQDVISGSWKSADNGENIADCSGVGYGYALELFNQFQSQDLDVPVGIINTAKGGSNIFSWIPSDEMQTSTVLSNYVTSKGFHFSESSYNSYGWENYNEPSALFNQKIAPLFNFQIAGVLWYQGESDALYDPNIDALQILMDSWSRGFNQNNDLLPFVFIQIAPYDGTDPIGHPSTSNYAYVGFPNQRLAQYDVSKMEKYQDTSTLVPIYDISLKWDVPVSQFYWKDPIHPVTKMPVGERSAQIAFSKFYSGTIDYLAPSVSGFDFDGTSITIAFEHVGEGLLTYKNADQGVLTVEVFNFNKTRQTVNCEIIDASHIRITGISTTNVEYVAYSFFTRNEESNLTSSYLIPAIPFKIKIQ